MTKALGTTVKATRCCLELLHSVEDWGVPQKREGEVTLFPEDLSRPCRKNVMVSRKEKDRALFALSSIHSYIVLIFLIL